MHYYASPRHEKLYRNVTCGKDYPAGTLAALYLLTAKRKLWKCFRKAVDNQGIEWAAGRGIDVGWDGFNLERAALSLCKPTGMQVSLHDLADPVMFPQELLRLVFTAIWIARNDPHATKEIMIKKGKLTAC